MTTQFSRFFSFVLIIAAWQTYRIWVLVFGALNGILFKAQAATMNAMSRMFN